MVDETKIKKKQLYEIAKPFRQLLKQCSRKYSDEKQSSIIKDLFFAFVLANIIVLIIWSVI